MDDWEIQFSARQTAGVIATARALARYQVEPSSAAAASVLAYSAAVQAYKAALNGTVQYLEEIKADPTAKTQKRDLAISQLWDTAHQAVFALDRELADKCFVKSQGWLDPTVWESPAYKEVGVSIEDMRLALLEFHKRHENIRGRGNEDTTTRVDSILGRLKNSPILAPLVVVAAIVVGLASFTDAIEKLETFFGIGGPSYKVNAGGPEFENPTLNGKILDACLGTTGSQTLDNGDPNACKQPAQFEIAGQFCVFAHYAKARYFMTMEAPGGALDTYKLFRGVLPDGTEKHAWNIHQGSALIFTEIGCTN